jgi:hypothetical protein
MSQIQGKQIADASINLNKLKGGSMILPSDATFGSYKDASDIVDANEFTTKEYVDSAVSASNGITDIIEHESITGSTSGDGVSAYSVDFDYSGVNTAKTKAKVYVNGVMINVPEHAFFSDSPTGTMRDKPVSGDKLYFNISLVGYHIEYDDLVQVTYYN